MKFACGLGPPRGDNLLILLSCLEGQDIDEAAVSSISTGVGSMNARLMSIFVRGCSSLSSIGEFEYDFASIGFRGGVLARPDPFRMKLFPRSYLRAFSVSILELTYAGFVNYYSPQSAQVSKMLLKSVGFNVQALLTF